jgi:hypothetical protein
MRRSAENKSRQQLAEPFGGLRDMARISASQLASLPLNGSTLGRIFQTLGVPDWMDPSTVSEGESGQVTTYAKPSQAALNALQGVEFDWSPTGDGANGSLQAYRGGQPVGSFTNTDRSATQALTRMAALAGVGFGGLGLAGAGPLAGLFGGGGAAAGAAGEAGALGIPGATYAVPGAEAGFGLANTAALGAEAGTVGGGITGALGTGALTNAAAVAAPAAAGAAGAGLWSSLISAGAPLIGSFITAGAQRTAGNTAADASIAASNAGIAQQNQQFAAIQKLLQPYVTAGTGALTGQQNLIGLNGAAPQQSAIDALKASPAFTSMQTLGENRILANASATGGLRGGNVQGALAQFSPQLLAQLIDQQYTRLGGLSQQGANAAAGVGTAGLNTGNQITQLLGQVGQAQGGAALSQGQATGTLANGFAGAAGQFIGSGGLKTLQPVLNNLGGLF